MESSLLLLGAEYGKRTNKEVEKGQAWILTVCFSQKTMTLKHDNQCELNVVTKPEGLTFTDHEIKIAFSNAPGSYTLAQGTNYTWTTGVATNFRLHAEAKTGNGEFESTNQYATVLFPSSDQILTDAGIRSKMDAKWQESLQRSTTNAYWELGFAIMLNSVSNEYFTTRECEAGPKTPGDNVAIHWLGLPGDYEVSLPTTSGTTYFVGLFHTHPPYEFVPINEPWRYAGPSRGSGGDITEANASGIPGFVYDYITPSDKVYPGHPEGADAHIYRFGPERKTCIHD